MKVLRETNRCVEDQHRHNKQRDKLGTIYIHSDVEIPFLLIIQELNFGSYSKTVTPRSLWGRRDQLLACFTWPPNSPILTLCDYYLWGFIKDVSLPVDLQD
ncbi:hypothetical protein C0J52_10695 [Blattella germanica]|nr:hypothetical protein C0J52_10695 [Blattella germanica]